MTTPFLSPKNKYRAAITYSKPLKEIGSCSTVTANSIDDLKSRAKFYIDQAHSNKSKSFVIIYENIKQFPDFEWKEIERYNA